MYLVCFLYVVLKNGIKDGERAKDAKSLQQTFIGYWRHGLEIFLRDFNRFSFEFNNFSLDFQNLIL